jgi:hypothetical protein
MTYFLLQHRHLRSVDAVPPSYPAALIARIKFGPHDAFGMQGSPPQSRTTAKQSNPARVHWNPNEGISAWEGPLLDALDTELQKGEFSARWIGNELTLSLNVKSQDQANEIVTSASQFIPAFLSLRLRVFVWIKAFSIEIGTCRFTLELLAHRYGITIASTAHNEECAIQSIHDWSMQRRESLRATMAIYYYRHAMRLAALEPDRQSMAAEVILNLAKAIEIIFSSDRDRLRSRAKEWGFDLEFIERWIVPVLLVRNQLDVAHAACAPLSAGQHQAVLDFLDRAFTHVHALLSRVFEMAHSGEVKLDAPSAAMDADKERLLAQIAQYAASE